MSGGLTALAITVSNDDMDLVDILVMLECWTFALFAHYDDPKLGNAVWSTFEAKIISEKITLLQMMTKDHWKMSHHKNNNFQEDDITKMLAATTHIGSDNSETTMEQYIFKKKTDGINIINLKKTWEKLVLAARAIAAVENPQVNICNATFFLFLHFCFG